MATPTPGVFYERKSKPSTTGTTGGSSIPFWGDSPALWDKAKLDNLELPGLCTVRGEGFEQKIQRVKAVGKKGEAHRYLGTASVDFDIICRMWTQAHLDQFVKVIKAISTSPPPKKVVRKVATTQLAGATLTTDANPFTPAPSNALATRSFGTPDLNVASLLAPVTLGTNQGSLTKYETTYEYSPGPRTWKVYHPTLEIFGIRACTIMKLGLPTQEHGHDVYTALFRCAQLHLGDRTTGTGTKTAPGTKGTGADSGQSPLAQGLQGLVKGFSGAAKPSTSLTGPK